MTDIPMNRSEIAARVALESDMFSRLRGLWLFAIVLLFCGRMYASPSTSVIITGAENFNSSLGTWDAGSITISITVNTTNVYARTVQYGQFSTTDSIASALAAGIASDCYGLVSAKSNGSVIYLKGRNGADISAVTIQKNGSISFDGHPLSNVTPTTTTALIGQTYLLAGQSTAVNVQVNCGTNCGDVVYRLDGGVWQQVSLDINGQASLMTNGAWTAGLHNVVVNYLGNGSFIPSNSNPVSFTISSSSTPTNPTGIYSYNITSYAGNGNIQAYSDSMNGSWSNIGYDGVNRLTSATQSINGATQNLCWAYDSFGNRTAQVTTGGLCSPSPTVSYTVSNQVQGLNYDAAGNLTGNNQYLYDAEGRLCAVKYSIMSIPAIMGYIYDAEGHRVAKGALTSFSCDLSINPSTGLPNNGFTETAGYALGPDGEQVTETDSQGNWVHTNVYAAGQLIATYDPQGLHFQLGDWLGTRRVQTDYAGNPESGYQSMPFGEMEPDNQTANLGATEHHFTGKERDTESGLDYFHARHYVSAMGRFMSPDWSNDPDAIPYADLENPQSLNLYGYVQNNPLSNIDPDGHERCSNGADADVCVTAPWPKDLLFMLSNVADKISSSAQQALDLTAQAFHQVTNIMKTPGGPGCLGASVAGGAMAGGTAGSSVGLAGLVGGPSVAVTESAGLVIGAIGGGATGAGLAMTACPGGAANGGGGGGAGRGGGKVPKKWNITNPTDKKVIGGRTYLKDGNTGRWWSRDTAGHGGSAWKVFEERSGGLQWIADADEQGNFIQGKWKSDAGMFVRF